MKFEDLTWQPHVDRPDLGDQAEHEYPNGWLVTFLRGDFSIHMTRGIYEMMVWKPSGAFPERDELFGNWPYHGDAACLQFIMDMVEAQPP